MFKKDRPVIEATFLRDARFAGPGDDKELLDGAILEGGVVVAVYRYTSKRVDPNTNRKLTQIRCVTEYPEATDQVPHAQSMIVSSEWATKT